MRIVPPKPAARAAGHPGATESPGLAPGKENVRSLAQVPAEICGKLKLADAVR
jgi:hypothetical protein